MKSALIYGLIFAWMIGAGAMNAFAGSENSFKREGWISHQTDIPYKDLFPRLKAAIGKSELRLITTASASAGAKGRGLTIPGNRVVGVYNNFFAVRMLEASVASGMEAPIRFYLTEREGGGSTLSYKTPTYVFSPYFEDGGTALEVIAGELDELFAQIAEDTIGE